MLSVPAARLSQNAASVGARDSARQTDDGNRLMLGVAVRSCVRIANGAGAGGGTSSVRMPVTVASRVACADTKCSTRAASVACSKNSVFDNGPKSTSSRSVSRVISMESMP